MKKFISSIMTKGIPARSRYLLDEDFYRRKYGLDKDVDAFNHFVKTGFKNDLNPNPIINIRFVKENYDVESFMDLVSFIENSVGNPSQYFDVEFYYETHSDVKAAGVPAVKHFLRNGRREGRRYSSMHNYTYNELIEIEAVGKEQSGEVYLKELKELAEKENDVELLPFEDHWDNSYALKHKFAIRSNKKIEKRARDDAFFGRKNVVIVGDLSIPQCKKYRIMQKMEFFQSRDVKCSFSHWLDVPRSINLIQTASLVIFYRIPHAKLVSSYIDECTRLGIKFGYDIDDPVFDLRIYSSNVNLNFITAKEKQSILSGVDSYASIIRQMDFVITSTPAMRSHLSDLTSKDIYIWRNVIDSETLNAQYIYGKSYDQKQKADKNDFIIVYASGSRAHEADFSMAIEALHRILNEYNHVKLNVIGYCAMSAKLKMRFPNRVSHTEFKDYVSYITEMAKGDLNIIPLVQDDFNDCKSAIRYLEASMVHVPTMVTAIGDFVNLIDNQVNGILINEPKDWYPQLKACVDGSTDLEILAKRANDYVLENQTIGTLEQKLDPQLKEMI